MSVAEKGQKAPCKIASAVEECWIIEAANATVTVCRPGIVFALHKGEEIQHSLLTRAIAVDAVFDV